MKEFEDLATEKELQIISVTETWGKEWITDGIFALKGYTMYRDDREDKGGGGTILYISDRIEHRVCRPLNTKDVESSAWCWITEKSGKKTLVGSLYRSPTSTLENNRKMLEEIKRAYEIAGNNRILILGDFNVPRINWDIMDLKEGREDFNEEFLEATTDGHLHQHVFKETRFMNGQSSTLDLIFTKEEGDIKNVEVLHPLGLSDHGVVIADFVCEWKSRVERKLQRMYQKGNYVKIKEELELVDWEIEFADKSVQECWEIFKAKLEALIDKYIPMSKPNDYDKPWMNKALMRLWRKKTLCMEKIHRKEKRPEI